MTILADVLDELTAVGELVQAGTDGAVRCLACAHRCLIRPGRRGICQVRFNDNGQLRVPWGYVAALQSDPIEKKPFSHVLPSANALTFGMLGCDFHCQFCQNWLTSQTGRDPEAAMSVNLIRRITPEQMVTYARRVRAEVVVSSYNEPLITSEWAVGIFKQARAAGLKCAFVSNGNATPEALEYLRPYLDAYKIDLKSMQDKNYRELGGVLKHVLETIRKAHGLGLWVEVVTLVIPGFNDSNDELWDAARFLAGVSTDIPWHVTAFHKDYHMTAPDNTPAKTLLRAAEIGREAGLRYVYAGNLPGRVDEYEDTHCPHCNTVVVKRRAYVIREYNLSPAGTCPKCGTKIAGIWPEDPGRVTLNGHGSPLPVY
jgi:pyruvate formate lyase activating enzyme